MGQAQSAVVLLETMERPKGTGRPQDGNGAKRSGNQPRTRRRHLLALGIPREEVHMATRSRKGYWRMSGNSILQRALTNRWLHEQGVPDMRTLWITLHYGPNARV